MDTKDDEPASLSVPTIKSLHTLIVDAPPSCIEFCQAAPDCFVVGTYELEKPKVEPALPTHDQMNVEVLSSILGVSPPQKRSGSLVLFELKSSKVIQIETLITTSAVLDLHFSPIHWQTLCIATAHGSLSLYRLDSREGRYRVAAATSKFYLSHIQDCPIFSPSTLVLSLAWHPTDANVVGVTLATGEVALCRFKAEGPAGIHSEPIESDVVFLHAHGDQAWTLAFANFGKCVFSGGDDSVLWYRQLPETSPHQVHANALAGAFRGETLAQTPEWRDTKIHGAGVTAILPIVQDIILTGSYDDRLRVIQISPYNKPKVVAELNLGGGVWRLKVFHRDFLVERSEEEDAPRLGNTWVILASCMYAGVRLVEVNYMPMLQKRGVDPPSTQVMLDERGREENWRFQLLAKFEEHESMNYGSDFRSTNFQTSMGTFVSTSFYDRRLCLWQYQLRRETEKEA